jgi:hypothetical protein
MKPPPPRPNPTETTLVRVRVGHGANCSSLGSSLFLLYGAAAASAAVFVALEVAARKKHDAKAPLGEAHNLDDEKKVQDAHETADARVDPEASEQDG